MMMAADIAVSGADPVINAGGDIAFSWRFAPSLEPKR